MLLYQILLLNINNYEGGVTSVQNKNLCKNSNVNNY